MRAGIFPYNRRMSVSAARAAAFDVLLRVEREDAYASELLHSQAYQRLSRADHGLATELAMGVLRWKSRLDEEIAKASAQAIGKLDLEVLLALRMAVYQFRWLDRVPARAALNESVELVKRARKRSAAGFVNAVLRKLVGKKGNEIRGENQAAGGIAADFAHPLWLVERWSEQYGLDLARRICEYDQVIPETALRLRSASAESELEKSGVVLRSGRLLSSARVVEAGDITSTDAFRRGDVVVQDEGSQLVAALVGEGSQILDCCAAPGGKTLAIADENPEATITAVELHAHRARLLQELTSGKSHGAKIEVVVGDARAVLLTNSFDRVLADVPCSGTGTLARNPEIKWRLEPEDLSNLKARQKEILQSSLKHVVLGGRVIYSTCSLEKEENEDVVESVVRENEGFEVIDSEGRLEELRNAGEVVWKGSLTRGRYLRTIPGVHPCDGFFAAIIGRGKA